MYNENELLDSSSDEGPIFVKPGPIQWLSWLLCFDCIPKTERCMEFN